MDLRQLIERLKQLSDIFYDNGIEDIYTNSKIYEVLMSEQFGHKIINGHANTLDAIDTEGNLYEYKHFKLSSTNHTWTFNDFSDATITKLYNVKSVYFAIIDDNPVIHKVKEVYIVKGSQVARYLENSTVDIYNHRKMINISRRQIINNMKYTIIIPDQVQVSNILREVFNVANSIEVLTGIRGILTSNKLVRLTQEPARFLATIQVAIILSGFLGSAFAADNFSEPLVDWVVGMGVNIPRSTLDTIAVILITLILSYFTLVFGELVPKRIAMKNLKNWQWEFQDWLRESLSYLSQSFHFFQYQPILS